MPGSGFGYAPFGEFPFGEWPWAKFEVITSYPKFPRQLDKARGGQLEELLDGLAAKLELLRTGATAFETLRDPLEVRTQYSDTLRLRLGAVLRPMGTLISQGVGGAVSVGLVFSDSTLRATPDQIGATLRIFSSTLASNNREVVISSIVSPTQVLTDPPLLADAGPLRWELRTTEAMPSDKVTVQVRGGDVSRVYPGWQLSDGVARFTVKARRRFLRNPDGVLSGVNREGADGTITIAGYLSSLDAQFSQDDVGRLVNLSDATEPTNNGRFWIEEVVSASIVRLNVLLTLDVGPFAWALYAFSELDLVGLAVPRGVVTQEGFDLSVIAAGPPAIVKAPMGRFSSQDVGKYLTLRGSLFPANNGQFEVTATPNLDELQLDATLTVEPGPLRWELRAATLFVELDEVEAAAPSMLEILAKDFGITIDTHESEFRQRLYVESVERWAPLRGADVGFEALGKISGFNVTVLQLFRVNQDIFLNLLLSGHDFEVGDIEAGHFGVDGALELVGARIRLRSATGGFTVAMEGRSVRVRNSLAPANDKLYQIETHVSTNVVEFRSVDTALAPEYGIGGSVAVPTLEWRLVDLLTDLPPVRPLFDEINGDLLTLIVGPSAFHLDIYCWDPLFLAEVTVTVLSAVVTAPNRWLVTVEGPADVVVQVGRWVLYDGAGVRHVLETVPFLIFVGPPDQFTFEVIALSAPTVGVGIVRYECDIQITCDYCASSRVMAIIESGDILSESGVSIERVRERVLERLETQAKPIRVDLIPRIRDVIEIPFFFTVELETGVVSSAPILIPFAYYFDEIPADYVPLDGSWGVEVETP